MSSPQKSEILALFLQTPDAELLEDLGIDFDLDNLSESVSRKCHSLLGYIELLKYENDNLSNTNNEISVYDQKINKKRTLIEFLSDDDDDGIDDIEFLDAPLNKKRKIDGKTCTDSQQIESSHSALITIQMAKNPWSLLGYSPFWICGRSTNTGFCESEFGVNTDPAFTPYKFMNQCSFPFIRFTKIPYELLSNDDNRNYSSYSSYSSYDLYPYNHDRCIKYSVNDAKEISTFISRQLDEFQEAYLNKNKEPSSYVVNTENNLLSHLFLMKEYYKQYYHEFINIISDENIHLILTKDIIQYTLFDYIHEIQIAKDIQYLHDNDIINQSHWFQFMFYFISFSTPQWQQLSCQILSNNEAYIAMAKTFMERKAKFASRHFKYPKLTEFCIKHYPKQFSSANIVGFLCEGVRLNDNDLFSVSLGLMDGIKPGVFWGKLLFQIVRNIESLKLYYTLILFTQICSKMKMHCHQKKKVIADSLDKFNKNFSNGLKFSAWNDDQLECVKVMQNVLNYDVNTIIPHCCSNYNLGMLQCLIEERFLNYSICKNNGYLKQMNNLISFSDRKRNKRETHSEFKDALTAFISQNSPS